MVNLFLTASEYFSPLDLPQIGDIVIWTKGWDYCNTPEICQVIAPPTCHNAGFVYTAQCWCLSQLEKHEVIFHFSASNNIGERRCEWKILRL